MLFSCLGGFYLTLFLFFFEPPPLSHFLVIFLSTLSVHFVIDSVAHNLPPSLLIQSLTHTIKARLCVFVSPIVTIFSFLLFPVRTLCHTPVCCAPCMSIFCFHFILCLLFTSFIFSFYSLVAIIGRVQHFCPLASLFCPSLLVYFLYSVPPYCPSIPLLIHSLTLALPTQPPLSFSAHLVIFYTFSHYPQIPNFFCSI